MRIYLCIHARWGFDWAWRIIFICSNDWCWSSSIGFWNQLWEDKVLLLGYCWTREVWWTQRWLLVSYLFGVFLDFFASYLISQLIAFWSSPVHMREWIVCCWYDLSIIYCLTIARSNLLWRSFLVLLVNLLVHPLMYSQFEKPWLVMHL